MVDFKEIPSQLGIQKGDKVFVSSDAKILLYDMYRVNHTTDINYFIDVLQEAVGPEGTLVFPTYNWGFCSGKEFDYNKTAGKTGALGVQALTRSDFKRTRHPIYSFAVWGKDQEMLCSLDNTDSFGSDSPFAVFHQDNYKNIIIDVTLKNCFTYAHYVEEMSGLVKFRYIKNFTAPYVDENGNRSVRTYSMFVRNLDLDVEGLADPLEPLFLEAGCEKVFHINHSVYKVIELGKAYQIIYDDVRYNDCKLTERYKGQS